MRIALIRNAVGAQYGAALKMLQGCIERAGRDEWLAPVGRFPFWHVAYHALFTTDMYLSPEQKAFEPQPFHREGYNFLGPPPWAPRKRVLIDQPYDKPRLAGYVGTCRARAKAAVEGESDAVLAGPSGFHWLPFTRVELHLYNIRHLQHHTGQLAATLRRQLGEGVPWSLSEPL